MSPGWSIGATHIDPNEEPQTRFSASASQELYQSVPYLKYINQESITDDPNTADRGLYKPVVHHRREGADLGSGSTLVQFSPPASPVHVKLSGFCISDGPQLGFDTPWNDLVVQLAQQVESAVDSKFMGAVFLKELKQTITMIRNPFGLFSSKLKRAIPRGMTAHIASQRKDLSNFWLEYRYGWKPLLSDVENFAKILAVQLNSSSFQHVLKTWKRFSASYKQDLTSSSPFFGVNCGGAQWESITQGEPTNWWNMSIVREPFLIRLVTKELTTTSVVSCQQLRAFGDAASLLENVQNILGLGNWMQLRDTLWEVLPFSFVVDWFINFNNLWRIPAESRLNSVDIKNLGYSTKRTYVFEPELQIIQFAWSWNGWPPPEYALQETGLVVTNSRPRPYKGTVGRTTTYTRSNGFPPTTENVFTSKGLTLLHGADAISLFSQRLR